MNAAVELGKNLVSISTRFSLSMEMSRLTRDVTAEPVSRDLIIRRERGQGRFHFLCLADHDQDWQPYPVDPYPYYKWFSIEPFYHRYDVCDSSVTGAGAEETNSAVCVRYRYYQSVRLC